MEGVQEQLEREARQRPRTAAMAGLSAILIIGGPVYAQSDLASAPRPWLLDSLARLGEGGPIGRQESLKLPFFEFVSDNVAALAISALLIGASILLLAGVMLFLARATQARGGPLPRVAPRLPLIGGLLFAGGGLITNTLGTSEHYDRMLEARTVDGIAAVNSDPGTMLNLGQSLSAIGAITLAVGIVLICLHAMRVGLLTRFLGVLGILVGVILGFSPFLGAGFSPVQMVWLLALAVLLAGRWPGGEPPAWVTGTAVPWPNPAEVREAREQAVRERRGEPKPEPKPERPTSGGPSPATSKKKRKKRG